MDTARNILVVGNGKDLPKRMHAVSGPLTSTLMVGTSGLSRVRDAQLHDRIVAINSRRAEDWTDTALALHRAKPFTHLANFSEHEQRTAAAVAQGLGLHAHPPATVEAVHDKLVMRARLAACGVPGPPAVAVRTPEEVVEHMRMWELPLVLKPVDRSGSAGVTVIRDPSEVAEAWRWGHAGSAGNSLRLMVEGFLDGPEYSVEAFSDRGRHFVAAVTAKHKEPVHCVELGHVIPAPVPANVAKQIAEHATRVLVALGVQDGVTHTEVVLTDAGPRVVETHLRPAGDDIPELVLDACGIDLAELLVRQAAGEDVRPAIEEAFSARSPHRAAAIWFGTAPSSGWLRAANVDSATRTPGVRAVTILADLGSTVVAQPRNSTERVFSVRTVGYTAESAFDAARRAAARVRLTVDDVAEPTPRCDSGD